MNHEIKFWYHHSPTIQTYNSEYLAQCSCGWESSSKIYELVIDASREHLQSRKEREVVKECKKLIYLASPHSHASKSVREDRYKAALDCTGWLYANGYWVFSPIVNSHLFYGKIDNGHGWEFWKEFDTELITRCDELWCLAIPGWKESVGVKAECRVAELQGKRIMVIVPDDIPPCDYHIITLSEELGVKAI